VAATQPPSTHTHPPQAWSSQQRAGGSGGGSGWPGLHPQQRVHQLHHHGWGLGGAPLPPPRRRSVTGQGWACGSIQCLPACAPRPRAPRTMLPVRFCRLRTAATPCPLPPDRVDRLRPAEQLTLKVASVLGLTVYRALLAAIHPQHPPPAALEASLRALEAAAFVRQDPADPSTWRFCQVGPPPRSPLRARPTGAHPMVLRRPARLPAWAAHTARPPPPRTHTPLRRCWHATWCTRWCPGSCAGSGTRQPPPPWQPSRRVGGLRRWLVCGGSAALGGRRVARRVQGPRQVCP
jgi:hypothetical protein